MEFHFTVHKSLPDDDYKLVAQTMAPNEERGEVDPSPITEEEIDYTAACASHAGHDPYIFELRKPWWTWSHYFLYVKEVVNE